MSEARGRARAVYSYENLYFTTVGSIQYKQYSNRIMEKTTYIKT